jgi:hypothetical protein
MLRILFQFTANLTIPIPMLTLQQQQQEMVKARLLEEQLLLQQSCQMYCLFYLPNHRHSHLHQLHCHCHNINHSTNQNLKPLSLPRNLVGRESSLSSRCSSSLHTLACTVGSNSNSKEVRLNKDPTAGNNSTCRSRSSSSSRCSSS